MGIPKTVIFNGEEYTLMGSGKYYLHKSNTNAGRKHPKGLHVAIWEHFSGKTVPKGYCIHHKDGNTFNNNYDNLECVKISEHLSYHAKKNFENPKYVESNKELLNKMRDKATQWHKSEKGRQWHSEHAKKIVWKCDKECVCKNCGKTFMSYHKDAKFCSDKCGEQYRAHQKRFTAVCKECGKTFSYGGKASTKRKFCSHSCATRYNNKHRAGVQHNS